MTLVHAATSSRSQRGGVELSKCAGGLGQCSSGAPFVRGGCGSSTHRGPPCWAHRPASLTRPSLRSVARPYFRADTPLRRAGCPRAGPSRGARASVRVSRTLRSRRVRDDEVRGARHRGSALSGSDPGFDSLGRGRWGRPLSGARATGGVRENKLEADGNRLSEVQERLYAHGRTGRLAGGAAGAAGHGHRRQGRHRAARPRHGRPAGRAAQSFGVPTEKERSHHYL